MVSLKAQLKGARDENIQKQKQIDDLMEELTQKDDIIKTHEGRWAMASKAVLEIFGGSPSGSE